MTRRSTPTRQLFPKPVGRSADEIEADPYGRKAGRSVKPLGPTLGERWADDHLRAAAISVAVAGVVVVATAGYSAAQPGPGSTGAAGNIGSRRPAIGTSVGASTSLPVAQAPIAVQGAASQTVVLSPGYVHDFGPLGAAKYGQPVASAFSPEGNIGVVDYASGWRVKYLSGAAIRAGQPLFTVEPLTENIGTVRNALSQLTAQWNPTTAVEPVAVPAPVELTG